MSEKNIYQFYWQFNFFLKHWAPIYVLNMGLKFMETALTMKHEGAGAADTSYLTTTCYGSRSSKSCRGCGYRASYLNIKIESP